MMATHLIFCFSAVVSVSASTDVFGLVGSSVQMNIQDKQDDYFSFKWTFEKSGTIILYNGLKKLFFNDYVNRVEFNETTHALILKDLKTSDSGLYQAKVDSNEEYTVSTYNLHVLDAVEKPNLNITCESSDSCNVTCSSGNLLITVSFSNATCNEKNETLINDGHVVLSLNLNNGFIICNVSNPVSSKHTSENIKQVNEFCSPQVIKKKFFTLYILIVLFIIVVVISSSIFICVLKKKRRRGRNDINQLQCGGMFKA